MKLRYLSVALRELEEAIRYYEDADPGLGLRFYTEVRNALERIKRFPEAPGSRFRNERDSAARRCFPMESFTASTEKRLWS